MPIRRSAGGNSEIETPSSASYTYEASTAALAKIPIESSVVERENNPSRGHSPQVVLRPTTPLSAAGTRTEPPVSEPTENAHMPAACATAEPLLEPPGILTSSGS